MHDEQIDSETAEYGFDDDLARGEPILVLASVDPTACLTHLGARVSASPFDLEPVDPLGLGHEPTVCGSLPVAPSL